MTFAESSPQKESHGDAYVATIVYFPLAVPVSVLGETLKRDRILQKSLATLGVTINFQTFAKGSDAIALIRQKKVDAIMVADMPTIDAAITGEMLIVGSIKRSYASVIGPTGMTLGQIQKKRIGNAFGSTSHYALLQALHSVSLGEDDVTIVPLDVNAMQDALAANKIDAFAAWEPTPTAIMNKYPGQYTNLYRQVSLSYFSLSRQIIDKKPEAAYAIAASVVRAIRWMKKGDNLMTASEWALSGMRNFTGKEQSLTAADIADITRTDLIEVSGAPRIPRPEGEARSPLLKEFEFLRHIGKLPANATSEMITTAIRHDVMDKILSDPEQYKINSFDYSK